MESKKKKNVLTRLELRQYEEFRALVQEMKRHSEKTVMLSGPTLLLANKCSYHLQLNSAANQNKHTKQGLDINIIRRYRI